MSDSRAEMPNSVWSLANMALIWLLRITIILNFARFALSFSPQFEGPAQKAGAVDRLLGSYKVFGFFRPDFAWLVGSTVFIFLAIFYFAKIDRLTRFDLFFCLAWIVASLVYFVKSLLAGVLYPG